MHSKIYIIEGQFILPPACLLYMSRDEENVYCHAEHVSHPIEKPILGYGPFCGFQALVQMPFAITISNVN